MYHIHLFTTDPVDTLPNLHWNGTSSKYESIDTTPHESKKCWAILSFWYKIRTYHSEYCYQFRVKHLHNLEISPSERSIVYSASSINNVWMSTIFAILSRVKFELFHDGLVNAKIIEMIHIYRTTIK